MKPPTCSRCQTVYKLEARESSGGQRGQRDSGKYPMLLRCGHTICQPCLRKCETSVNIIQCPKCQKTTKRDFKGVNPDMYTVGVMWTRRLDLEHQCEKIRSDRGKSKKTSTASSGVEKTGPLCGECQKAAHCQCLKCESVLCRPCFDMVHSQSFGLRKHQPAPLQGGGPFHERLLQKTTRSRMCSTHEQCQIEYYCNQDNQPICSRCVIMGDHKGHDVLTLEDKNKESLSEMEPAMLAVQETVWRLKKSEQVVSQMMPQTQVDTSSVVEEVKLHFRELHSLLQAREEQIVEDMMEAAVKGTKSFEDTKSFLENEKCKLEIDMMDAARAMQGNIHTLIDADLILERLKKAKDIPCMVTIEKDPPADPIKFSFDTKLKDVIGTYGTISSPNAAQMFSLNLPGPDAPKPPPQELHCVALPDLEIASNDDESASVIVEGEREETESVENTETSEQPDMTQSLADKPGKRLVVGHSEKINMTHIRTPAQFYIQLQSGRGELETMQRHINQYCRSLDQQGKKDPPECLKPGSLVLAQFSQDKNWYRAVVTKAVKLEKEDKEGTSYEVFFMDYGNSEKLTSSKLRPMKKKFENHPAFAYECTLYNLVPTKKEQSWTEESVKVMLDMTSVGTVLMKVMEDGVGALSVDLIKPETNRHCVDDQPSSLRDTFLFLGLADTAVPTAIAPQHPPGVCVKDDYISLARPHDGEVLDVMVTSVENPCNFIAQWREKSNMEYLQRLSRNLQDIYSGENSQRYTIFCPRKGMKCVAKFKSDGRWYRAQVTEIFTGGDLRVRFVDYGNTEYVPYTDIRKILQDHIKLPEQAIQCSLVDVAPLNLQWEKEIIDWFTVTVQERSSQIRVVGHSDKANVVAGVLYVISPDNNELCCVNAELARRGFASGTGMWSSKECFEGITLQPEPAVNEVKSTSPSPKSGAGKTITLRNLHQSPESAVEKGPEEDGAGQLKSMGVEVVVTGYRHPSHFFIQLKERRTALSELMGELEAYKTEPVPERDWKVGECCVALQTQTAVSHRANITRVLEDHQYEVNLMDYGLTDIVPASGLRLLKHAHGKVECFAERCHLVDLAPVDSMDKSQWTYAATELMSKEVNTKRLFVKVEGEKTSDLGLPVDILVEEKILETALDPLRYRYISLVKRLQDRGLAISLKKPRRSQSPESDTTDPEEDVVSMDTDGNECLWGLWDPEKESMEPIEQPDIEVMPHPAPTSTTLTVMPVHIDVQGVIYAHDLQDEDQCTKYMNKLDDYGKQIADRSRVDVRVGQVCLAFYSPDKSFYRARLLEDRETSVKVQYIDYGNTEVVDKHLLRLLSPEMSDKHQMTHEFKLHNLQPTSRDGSWSPGVMEYLDKWLVNNKCTAVIKGDLEKRPLEVDLLLKGGKSISASLLETGRAIKVDDMDDFCQRAADIGNILQHSNPYFPLRLGESGTMLTALVTHMDLPNMVYLQRCPASSDNGLPEDLVKFAQMMDELNNEFSNKPQLNELPSVGEMCCAQYSNDDRWYRALVAKTYPDNPTVLVFYVDYGNSEVVSLSKLQGLPDQFRDMPAQALRAYLNVGLPAFTPRWTLDVFKAMGEAVYMHRHLVLIKFTDPLTVELFSEQESQNEAAVLSYQPLVDQGLIIVPTLVMTDVEDGENVIVESCTEEDNASSSCPSDID